MAEFSGPSASDIAEMLRDRAEELGMLIFPNAVKMGGFLCVGSIEGEPGNSLKIQLRGPKRGTWADYAKSQGERGATGDMLTLVKETLGNGDMAKGVAEAKRFLHLDSMDPRAMERQMERSRKARAKAEAEAADEADRKRRNSEGLWFAGSVLTPSSPPVQYLAGRGIDLQQLGKLPGAIRFHHRVSHAEMSAYRKRKVYLPAMVTKIQLLCGMHGGTHVTYLHYDGARGWVKLPPVPVQRIDRDTGEVSMREEDCAKKIFSPLYRTGHIALWKGATSAKSLKDVPAGLAVECSEGIEDGLSYALAKPDARVIAAAAQGNIGVLELPVQAGNFNLLAQNDTKEQALAAREKAIRQQQEQALRQGSDRVIGMRMPPAEFKDWNDWLRGVAA